MRKMALTARDWAFVYLKWGWPVLLADVLLGSRARLLNGAALAWILCAAAAPLLFLLDRGLRERAMARLFGLREGDERERAVTGEAARATLLLALSLQVVLLALSLVTVRLFREPSAPEGHKNGLSVGVGFSTAHHLDPFGTSTGKTDLGAGAVEPGPQEIAIVGGFLVAPSTFPVLALLILVQLAAFKAFAMRRYEGTEA